MTFKVNNMEVLFYVICFFSSITHSPSLTILLKCIDSRTECAIMQILAHLYYALCTNKLFPFFLTVYAKRWSILERLHLCLLNLCRSGMDYFRFLHAVHNISLLFWCIWTYNQQLWYLWLSSFFRHWGFLLRHSTFRMSCVWVSGWGPHWYVFLAHEEILLSFCKRLYSKQASLESIVELCWDHSYFY